MAMSLNNEDRNWLESMFGSVFRQLEAHKIATVRELGGLREQIIQHSAEPCPATAAHEKEHHPGGRCADTTRHEEVHHAIGWTKIVGVWVGIVGGLVGILALIVTIWPK